MGLAHEIALRVRRHRERIAVEAEMFLVHCSNPTTSPSGIEAMWGIPSLFSTSSAVVNDRSKNVSNPNARPTPPNRPSKNREKQFRATILAVQALERHLRRLGDGHVDELFLIHCRRDPGFLVLLPIQEVVFLGSLSIAMRDSRCRTPLRSGCPVLSDAPLPASVSEATRARVPSSAASARANRL